MPPLRRLVCLIVTILMMAPALAQPPPPDTAGGAGLRLLINKRSKTNLCLDFDFGKQGSKGVYLAVQEAF